MATYKHNKYQRASFWCWGIGGLLIVLPLLILVLTASSLSPTSNTPYVASAFMGLGVVLLATGGTLHKVGSGRERKD